MKLSIIIVSFNTKDFLKQCLDSIKKGIEGIKGEIIVVDNGSTDGSVREIQKSKIKYQNDNLKFKIILNRKNLGFSKANNQALRQSQGKYILLLNPDTIVPKETLPFMIQFMEKNKNVGIATCRVELPSGELDDACHRGFPTPWNALCHFLGLGRLFPHSRLLNGYHLGYQDMNMVHEIDACAGAFLLIRREVGKKVGWFDEDYFWYGEDLDLCFRVKKAGWKIMFVPDVKIIHYKGAASGIKKRLSVALRVSKETKILATKARFDVMRIFYNKHYRKEYPQFIRWLVLAAIEIKRRITLLRIKI